MAKQQLFRVYNVKANMPSVEEARRSLISAIRSAKADGVQVLKVIHGYGSTGVGGSLRDALRKSLLRRKKEGMISVIVHGEDWNIFSEHAREVCERHPELRGDPDYNRENPGVTLIEF